MTNLSVGNKWRSPRFLMGMGIGCILILSGGLSYFWLRDRPVAQNIAVAAPKVESVSALGRLEPEGEVIQVFAPTSIDGARVENLKIKHGQQIRKGDLIAVLDTYARWQAALEEAQEQVTVATAQLRQVEAGAKLGQIRSQSQVVDRQAIELETETAAQRATIARLEAELRNAELEDRRFQSLYTTGAVSESLRDTKQLTADTVRQQLNEAKANLNRIQLSRQSLVLEAQATLAQIAEVRPVDVNLAQAQLARAQAGVKRAEAEKDLALVRSPQNGQVLKIHTRNGEIVGNKGIISLGQTQRMVAVAEVYELDVSRIRIGQTARVTSKNNAFPEILQGKVSEVGLEINKQDVLNTDPAAKFDARVVEVRVVLDPDSSRRVGGLTNLSVEISFDVNS
jgi:HlyD family secretion protein